MKKILIPVDSEKPCEKTMDMAKEMAQKYSSEIIILHVNHHFEPMSHPYAEISKERSPEAYDAFMEMSNKLVTSAASLFDGTGINVKSEVVNGDAASVICDYAEEKGCDMIVMCSHGHGAMRRFLLGGITSKVVHHAKVPVMVVR